LFKAEFNLSDSIACLAFYSSRLDIYIVS
jgi:hypothetical protein